MATTTRSNLIVPEIMQEAVQGEFAGMTALYGTSAAVVNGSLPQTNPTTGVRVRGGDTITVPYFDTLGELEEVAEGSGLVPAQLTMSDEAATVKHAGKMFELSYWAQLAANFADPYAEAARQLRVATNRYADQQEKVKAAVEFQERLTTVVVCAGVASDKVVNKPFAELAEDEVHISELGDDIQHLFNEIVSFSGLPYYPLEVADARRF